MEGTVRRLPGISRDEGAAIVSKALLAGGGWLEHNDVDALLRAYGITIVNNVKVKTPEAAGTSTGRLTGKVVLKAVAPGLIHKTEAGAVKLNLEGQSQVSQAAKVMMEQLESKGLQVSYFEIQPMVSAVTEMIIGITHDQTFGSIVVCGFGGILVELLNDISIRIVPLTDIDAEEMLHSLKMFPVLNGYRGGPKCDLVDLEELLLRIGNLAEDIPDIAELDLNPVMVWREGEGVTVDDARVRIEKVRPPLPLGAKGD
jgi:acyl-CoA synthetase (NDP forming)